MLFQSKTAKRRATPPVPYQAGMKAVAIFEYKFTQAFTAATDLLEIGVLPAGARLINATTLSNGLGGTTTIDVGLMDGEAGSYDETRTAGVELLNDGASTAAQVTPLASCLAIAPVETHRGIGVALSANEAAGAGKSITLVIEYTY